MTDTATGRGARLDPDALAALEEERDFLLRSLDDLEREHEAGDIDAQDYRTLKDDYTARAAEVLRAIDEGRAAIAAPRTPTSARRRIVTVVGVVLVAVVAGVLVAESSGRRGSGSLTGLDVTAASSRVDDCQQLEQEGAPEDALDCYSEILEALPGNAAALTFRGWLQVREFDAEQGLADLDDAVRLEPDSTAPYLFRSIARFRGGDAPEAVADLASFYGNGPAADERALAESFTDSVVDGALDACIQAETTGALPAVEAVQCYRNVLEVDPGNPSARAYLGWLLARAGVTDEAGALLDAAIDQDDDLSAAYVFRAALRGHLGDVEGALADLDHFDTLDAPADQREAAQQVREAVVAGEDPLPG